MNFKNIAALCSLSPGTPGERVGVRGIASLARPSYLWKRVEAAAWGAIPLTPDPSPPEYRGRGELTTRSSRVGLVALLAVAAGCGQPATKTVSPAANTSTVALVHPQRKSLVRVIEQPGTIQAYEEARLFARVPGYVDKVHVDIGQPVRGPKVDAAGKEVDAGQLLGEISAPELQEEANQKTALVKQAVANVEQAQSALAAAEAGIATAEASVVEAKALSQRWESESRRIANLTKDGVVDAQTRDETLNQYKAAQARVLSAEANVRKSVADRDKAKADVRAADAKTAVTEADARRLAALLVFAKIRAPFDGVVTQRKVNTGDLVQPSKSEWLFTVARTDPVRVVVFVPEADAPLVREQSEATLAIPSIAGPVSGTISRTSWALEPGTRTLRAEIDLPNKDGRFRPGAYVSARINGKLPEAWTLPSPALVKIGDTTYCFLVDAGKAVRTAVQVGRSDGTLTEVFKRQGATANTWQDWTGQESVAARAAGLADGQPINPPAGK